MLAVAELPEAYHDLCKYLALDAGIPYVEKWSAAADFLQLLIDHVNSTGPSQILECGSGLTTIILAAACNRLGEGQIVTLEQEREYVQSIQQVLDQYMLADRVEVIHAPLSTYQVDGMTFQWYSLDALTDISADMLVIDGPPGMLQQHSRYPA